MASPEQFIIIDNFSAGIHGDFHAGAASTRGTADPALTGYISGNGAARVDGTERCRADRTGALVPMPRRQNPSIGPVVDETIWTGATNAEFYDQARPGWYVLDAQVGIPSSGNDALGRASAPIWGADRTAVNVMWGFWWNPTGDDAHGNPHYSPYVLGREYRPWVIEGASGDPYTDANGGVIDFMFAKGEGSTDVGESSYAPLPVGSLAKSRFYYGYTTPGELAAGDDNRFRMRWWFPVVCALAASPWPKWPTANRLAQGAIPETEQAILVPRTATGTSVSYFVFPGNSDNYVTTDAMWAYPQSMYDPGVTGLWDFTRNELNTDFPYLLSLPREGLLHIPSAIPGADPLSISARNYDYFIELDIALDDYTRFGGPHTIAISPGTTGRQLWVRITSAGLLELGWSTDGTTWTHFATSTEGLGDLPDGTRTRIGIGLMARKQFGPAKWEPPFDDNWFTWEVNFFSTLDDENRTDWQQLGDDIVGDSDAAGEDDSAPVWTPDFDPNDPTYYTTYGFTDLRLGGAGLDGKIWHFAVASGSFAKGRLTWSLNGTPIYKSPTVQQPTANPLIPGAVRLASADIAEVVNIVPWTTVGPYVHVGTNYNRMWEITRAGSGASAFDMYQGFEDLPAPAPMATYSPLTSSDYSSQFSGQSEGGYKTASLAMSFNDLGDLDGLPIDTTDPYRWYHYYWSQYGLLDNPERSPYEVFNNPYMLISHQGRLVVLDRRLTAPASTLVLGGDNGAVYKSSYLDDVVWYSDFGLPMQTTKEPDFRSTVAQPFVMAPYNSLTVAEDIVADIGTAGVVSADQVLFVKHRGGGAVVSGDMDQPSVRRLPSIEPTGGIVVKGAQTPIGFVYGSPNGIFVWEGGDTTKKLSPQIDGFFWNHTDGTPAERYAGQQGRFAYWNGMVCVPNNYVLDLATNSWWRLASPGAAYNTYDEGGGDDLYAFPYKQGGATNPISTWYTYSPDKLDTEYSWTSHPLVETRGRTLSFQSVQIVATAFYENLSTITATLTGYDIDARELTSRDVTFNLPPGDGPQFLKADLEPNFQAQYVTLRLDASGGLATGTYVRAFVESNDDVAPRVGTDGTLVLDLSGPMERLVRIAGNLNIAFGVSGVYPNYGFAVGPDQFVSSPDNERSGYITPADRIRTDRRKLAFTWRSTTPAVDPQPGELETQVSIWISDDDGDTWRRLVTDPAPVRHVPTSGSFVLAHQNASVWGAYHVADVGADGEPITADPTFGFGGSGFDPGTGDYSPDGTRSISLAFKDDFGNDLTSNANGRVGYASDAAAPKIHSVQLGVAERARTRRTGEPR